MLKFEDNNYRNYRNSQHAGKKFKHNAFVYFPETDKDLDDKDKKTKATKTRTKKQKTNNDTAIVDEMCTCARLSLAKSCA